MGETSSFGGFKPGGGKSKKTDKSKATENGTEGEFAEHSSEEEDSSDEGTDHEALQRDQDANTYYYKCPVFRTTLRLRTGEISSDNKPVFYIKLPSLIHPRKWVKRSVALLMETYR